MQVGVAQLEQVCDPHGMWPTIILRAVAQRVSLLRRPAGISLMLARSVAPSGCAGPRSGPSAVPTVQCPFASLVALITRRGLLFCAKHLFVAAIGGSSEARQARGVSTFQSRRDCPGAAARANPRMSVSAVMIAASLGWAAMAIAAALLAEKETAPHNGSRVVRAQGLARP